MGVEAQADDPRRNLAEHIQEAVEKLLNEDILLRQNVNERAISHRLALHLEEVLDEKAYLEEYPHVDIEYNRIGDEGNPVAKRLNKEIEGLRRKIKQIIEARNEGPESQVERILDELQNRLIYPDIIVHERGGPQNLLVIELKKGTRSCLTNEDEFDHTKLTTYTDEGHSNLNYTYGIFLKLRVEAESSSAEEAILDSAWFENGEKIEDNPLSI